MSDYEKITENVSIHQTLPDNPNLPATELKKKWDEAPEIIKEKFNRLIDTLAGAEIYVPTVLFEDNSGQRQGETITLNDDESNYDYVEIYYQCVNGGFRGYNKVENAYNKLIALGIDYVVTDGSVVQHVASSLRFMKKTALLGTTAYYNASANGLIYANDRLIIVTKIIGYKKLKLE